MLEFVAVRNGQKGKTFKASNMNTVYNQYNKYCQSRGCIHRIQVPISESYGGLAWTNGKDIASREVIMLRQVTRE